MGIVICKMDIGKMVLDNGGTSPIIKVPKMDVEVEIPKDQKVEKALKENPLLQQQMVDGCKKLLNHAATLLAKEVKLYENLAQDSKDGPRAVQDKWKQNCETVRKGLITTCTKECQAVWDRLLKTKSEYTAYKIVTTVKLGLNALSVGGGVASLAVAGWTGAGTVIGIVSVLRGLSAIGQKLVELAKEAEGIQVELEATIDIVVVYYRDKGPKEVGATEIGLKLWAEVTTHKSASISKCEDQLKVFKSKLDGVEIHSHQFAKGLNTTMVGATKTLRTLEDWQGKVTALKLVGAKANDLKTAVEKSKKLEKTLEKAEAATRDLIAKTTNTVDRVKKGRKAWERDEALVKELLKKVPTWSMWGQKAVKLVNLAFATDLAEIPKTLGEIAADLIADSDAFTKAVEKVV